MKPFDWKFCILFLIILLGGYCHPFLLRAQDLSPPDRRNMKRAIKLFEKDRFEEAYDKLSNLYFVSTNNILLNGYLGECCYKLGRYSEAKRYFENSRHSAKLELEMMEPSSPQVGEYIRKREAYALRIQECEKKLDNIEKVLPVKTKADPSPLNSNIKNNIVEDKIQIDNLEKTITDDNQNLHFMAFEINPICYNRFQIHKHKVGQSWAIPSEKELRILLQLLINHDLFNTSFLVEQFSDFPESNSFLTRDTQFPDQIGKFICLKVIEGKILIVHKEPNQAAILLLRKEKEH